MSKPVPPVLPATESYADVVNRFRNDLIRIVFKISENSNTATRAAIDGFGRLINPQAADHGESNFAFNVRPHFRNPTRTCNFGKIAVMLSLTGIAVLDYYRAVKDPNERTCGTLMKALLLLDSVAMEGLNNFHVIGDDVFGYTLERLPETKTEGTQDAEG